MMKTMRKGVSSLALGLVLVGLSWAMQSSAETLTKLKPLSDPALEALLKQQLEPEERVQLQSLIKADLEPGLPGEETAVIWTLLGPSYWSNHLSLLSQHLCQCILINSWLYTCCEDNAGRLSEQEGMTIIMALQKLSNFQAQ